MEGWGAGNHGQLGTGGLEESVMEASAVHTPTPDLIVACCGGAHTLFLYSDGSVLGCGQTSFGQLGGAGSGDTVGEPRLLPLSMSLPSSVKVKACSAGWDFSVFVSMEGAAYGCGSNKHGQLLRGGPERLPNIVTLGLVETFKSVSCGVRHTLLLHASGRDVLALGDNRHGQCGQREASTSGSASLLWSLEPNSSLKEALTSGDTIVQVAAGNRHSLLLLAGGLVFAVGDNRYGQLGQSALGVKRSHVPHPISLSTCSEAKGEEEGSETFVPLHASYIDAGWNHCTALARSGEIVTWGRNDFGQLGVGERSRHSAVPRSLPSSTFNGLGVQSVAAGSEHNVAVVRGPTGCDIYSWGWNEHGQLGLGDERNRLSPQLVMHVDHESASVFCGTGGHSFLLRTASAS